MQEYNVEEKIKRNGQSEERITLGHGSGGELTNKLLNQGVFSVFKNPYLNRQHDGAFIDLDGQYAFTTDSFVVSPVIFPGGNIGDLAVNGTINDLAMCGARPEFISLAFILEEGLPVSTLNEIIKTIDKAAKKAGVFIVTGDTKVVNKGKGDQIFINTSGIGRIHKHAQIDINRIKAGDKIIVSGEVANHGISIMSKREGLEFETTIESDTRPLNHVVRKLLDNFGKSINFLRDPTRGGVATVLNEIAVNAKKGIKIYENKIPLNPVTSGACEMLGLDPLFVANEGIFLAIVDPTIADEVVELLKSKSDSKEASIIGEVVQDHATQVVEITNIGGQRIVPMLAGEQLPRIC